MNVRLLIGLALLFLGNGAESPAAAPGDGRTSRESDTLQQWKRAHADESNPLQKTLGELPQERDVSPNGKYAVEFAEERKLGFTYRIIALKSGDVLATLRSSYQDTDGGDAVGYRSTLSDAKGAVVYWSKDSRYIAIEESNDRFKGTVLAAFVVTPNRAQEAVVPRDMIKAKTNEHWDRCRLWVAHPPWTNRGLLHLILAGKTIKRDKSQVAYDVVIQVGSSVRLQQIVPSE